MSEVVKYLLALGTGGVVTGFAIVLLIYLTPEKAEKWYAILLGLFLRVGGGVRGLHKRWVRHDIQGRINDFVKSECASLPGSAADRVRLEYIDGRITKQAVLDGNTVIVRLRRDDPEELNFVHGVCLFVSRSLLFKAKRYISPAQGEATDLLVSKKLLEHEKPAVVDHFLEQYLHPAIDRKKSSTARFFDDLVVIDAGKLFVPIYLQELNFLGHKVFGGRKDALIIQEVTDLIQFLKDVVNREVGQQSDLDFRRGYCRFAIVIVGKAMKLRQESISPYLGFIREHLVPDKIETVYLLAPSKNTKHVRRIAETVADIYDVFAELEFERVLQVKSSRQRTPQYLLVLRARDRDTYIPKDVA
jgi:hypothetical protein